MSYMLHQRRGHWTLIRLRRGVARYGREAAMDAVIVVLAYCCGLLLRLGPDIPLYYWRNLAVIAILVAPLYVTANLFAGLYFGDKRWPGMHDVLTLARSTAISTILVMAADAVIHRSTHPLPIGAILIAGMLIFTGCGAVRFWNRVSSQRAKSRKDQTGERLLIVGAGQAGQWLAHTLLNSPGPGYQPVGFIDDDPRKLGVRIHGLPVLGTRSDIVACTQRYSVEVLALAIPSLSADGRRALLACCDEAPVRIKVLPGVPALLETMGAKDSILRDARIDEIIGRSSVQFEDLRLWRSVLSETVLITGAAGSIGSELARQVMHVGPRRLLLLDNNETGLFDLQAELSQSTAVPDCHVEAVIASTTDARKIHRVFQQFRPQVVFHAAAYKHVPLMEQQPDEAVKVNVGGTQNVCLAADANGCERLVLISTDKAVDAANAMGASKRVGEWIVQTFSGSSTTVFCSVRFGNVLGSRGSVVPTFERQIRAGGPVTVTDPEATRYFMTIPEAANLIIEASCFAEGGETFILDMGSRVRIDQLARRLIRLHGLRPDIDVKIQYTGLRPGDKLHETLTYDEEEVAPTPHPRVLRACAAPPSTSRSELGRAIGAMVDSAENGDLESMLSLLYRSAAASGKTGEGSLRPPTMAHVRVDK